MKNKVKIFFEVFKQMLVEELRMNTELFGKKRYIFYPVIIGLMFGLFTYLMTQRYQFTTERNLLLLLHILIFIFGIQAGSLAFKQRDAIENLIGEYTQILYANRTLPITPKIIISSFILKDILLYSILFFIPMSITMSVFLQQFYLFPVLIFSTITSFWLGLSITLLIASVSFKSKKITLGFSLSFIFVVIYYFYSYGMPQIHNYSLNPISLFLGLITLASTFTILGILLFEPPKKTEKEKRKNSLFIDILWSQELPKNDAKSFPIFLKTIYEIKRSGGGLIKVFFSTIILGILGISLISVIETTLGILPYKGITLMVILSMGMYGIYVWIYRIDSIKSYNVLPISLGDLTSGKSKSFYFLSLISVLIVYLPVSLYYKVPWSQNISSIILLLGFIQYYYSVSYYNVKFSPFISMFDSVSFTKFSIIIMVTSFPLLLLGIFGEAGLNLQKVNYIVSLYGVLLFVFGSFLKLKIDDNNEIQES